MAREYFCAYHSYRAWMETLSDAEKGRLFDALLLYSESGEQPSLSGKEAALFPAMKWSIDRDAQAYEAKCEKNRINGANGSKRHRSVANAPRTPPKEKVKEKEKAKENTGDTPCNPPVVLPAIDGFSPEMTDKLREWLMYKQERREGYKAIGLKNLLAMVRGKIEEHGEQAVLMRISEAMASGWVGMNLDKMPVSRAKTGGFADVKGEW